MRRATFVVTGLGTRRVPGRAVAAVAAIGASAMLAACGSSSDSDSKADAAPAASSSGATAAVTAAKADVQKYLKEQPPITVAELPKRPPTDKSVVITTCGQPVCRAETDPAGEAAKRLGWKVRTIQTDVTPESILSGWDQILQTPPDLIAYSSFVPTAVVAKKLAAAAAKKIPIVNMAPQGENPASPDGPIYAAITGPPELAESGRLMAQSVVADAGAKAKTIWVTDPQFAIWKPAQEAFTKAIKAADGSVDVLSVPVTEIGKNLPNQVVSYLQSHTDVKYVAFAVNDMTAGVVPALKVAGLTDKVKLLSRAPQPANIRDIRNGAQWVGVLEENSAGGYRAIDGLARIVLDVPLTDEERNPVGWHQILDKTNVPAKDVVPSTPGVPEVFYKAWHLSD